MNEADSPLSVQPPLVESSSMSNRVPTDSPPKNLIGDKIEVYQKEVGDEYGIHLARVEGQK